MFKFKCRFKVMVTSARRNEADMDAEALKGVWIMEIREGRDFHGFSCTMLDEVGLRESGS